jgi:prepilin-type N-terminal cleavage/methylation domain-containing protein
LQEGVKIMQKKKQGFTLIELVVVIAILGILAGIAIPRFLDAQATARGAKILADMRTLESAVTLYTQNNTIPIGNTDLSILTTGTKKYMAAIPAVPSGKAIFPQGFTDTFDTTKDKYQLYKHKTTGDYFIILNHLGQLYSIEVLESISN